MNYPNQEWRLLTTPASPGAWNMAVDEAILEAVENELALPTLRLYSWEPPCLSIGYAQTVKDIDLTRLNATGWDWVRRPTGGRAILHTDELTYSVIAPLTDPRVNGSVLESYQRLSAALLKALQNLNIAAKSLPNNRLDPKQRNAPVCFEVPSNYEIVIDNKKLIGSAQARRKNMLLQHGTFPLSGDLTRITQVLLYPDETARREAASRLLDHATTVEKVLGKSITFFEASQAFITAFQYELNLTLIPAEISAQEAVRAEQLVREKYAHPSWLERI